MNLDNLNKWLTLAANIGVLAGIFFLATEIQQNTSAVEREIELSQQNIVLGQFLSPDRLTEILTQINEFKGHAQTTREFAESYELSLEDATMYTRYLTQVWLQNETNWQFSSDKAEICEYSARLLGYEDNEIFWKNQKTRFDQDFIQCIEDAESSIGASPILEAAAENTFLRDRVRTNDN